MQSAIKVDTTAQKVENTRLIDWRNGAFDERGRALWQPGTGYINWICSAMKL